MRERLQIAPSILAADFARLGEHVREAARGGADMIHLDVMDGRFVPNLTFGPPVIEALRPHVDTTFDAHLMAEQPDRYVGDLARAGADLITVHVEATRQLRRVVGMIKDAGAMAGAAINPATPLSALEEALPHLDVALIMCVNPGFGGQAFIESSVRKIERLRATLDGAGLRTRIEVDGGIGPGNAERVAAAGADILVAGSAVFQSALGVRDAIRGIRERAERGVQTKGQYHAR